MTDYKKEQEAILQTPQFNETPVMTADGWKTIGDIKVGDKVFNCNGEVDDVVEISSSVETVYLVKFDNNFSIELPETVSLPSVLKGYPKKEDFEINTVKNILRRKEEIHGLSSYYLPKVDTFDGFNEASNKKLLIDPYVLGVWLGDGHSSCGLVTNMYENIFKEIESRGYSIGPDVSGGGTGKACTRRILTLVTDLKKYDLLGDKHVPVDFLTAGKDVLRDVICGYMDTDGYFNKTRKRYHLSTTRSKQVIFLSRMLSSYGIKSTIIKTATVCEGKTIPSFEITFSPKENFFKSRKIDVIFPKQSKSYLLIKSFKKLGERNVTLIKTKSDKPILLGNNLLEVKI